MMQQPCPILEYDPSTPAMLEPSEIISPHEVPEHAVACFFQPVIAKLIADHQAKRIGRLASEIGEHPFIEVELQGKRLAVFHPGVGAPLAAALLDEVIAFGCRKFIACGGAGVLVPNLAVGHLVVPTAAVRDEGTSYHYLPPSREVEPSPEGVAAIEQVLTAHNLPYLKAKTWTTDAIYRETQAKVAMRRAEGCATVEMEAAGFFAVARFRGVSFAQLLYGGDDLSTDTWDGRGWAHHAGREALFWLAAEACLLL